MSRRIDICPTCKGKGEIIVDNWLTEGSSEEELAKEAEEALADIVEVVRCKHCNWGRKMVNGYYSCVVDRRLSHNENDYCSYGERRGNDNS